MAITRAKEQEMSLQRILGVKELYPLLTISSKNLSTDYFGTPQIIFGNNMNTIEMH